MWRLMLWACLLGLTGQVQAFGSVGHQQVCAVAYQLVQPQTRQHIDALLQLAPVQDFAEGCIWPDDARNQPAYHYTAAFHYLNVPRSQHRVTAADCAAKGCLLSALSHYAALLRQPEVSRQRAEALLFYAHFVADLHQPLHVSYADDMGGNKTALYYFKQPSNLHGIWDSAMLKSLGYAKKPALAQEKLQQQSQATIRQWQRGEPLVWAQQSLQQTRQIYRTYRPGMLFSDSELQRDGPAVELRLLQAAVRLAWQLDQLLLQPAPGN